MTYHGSTEQAYSLSLLHTWQVQALSHSRHLPSVAGVGENSTPIHSVAMVIVTSASKPLEGGVAAPMTTCSWLRQLQWKP